ncbi:MAG: hypothetical protein JOZ18_08665 [Chloroflexi bacterium]|nr:hypothetical protein [Chloroflexota bacterium]
MPTSVWGGPESYGDEISSSSLLKYLLKQMMAQFSAQGACIALYDERLGQMRSRLHVRLHGLNGENSSILGTKGIRLPSRRATTHLENETQPTGGRMPSTSPAEELDEIPAQQCELFAAGTTYPIGHDLIGHAWLKNDAYMIHHDEYLLVMHEGGPLPFQTDIVPSSYLIVPVQEVTLAYDMQERKRKPAILGVIVLYQTTGNSARTFQPKQRAEALQYVERIALYLQNDQLQRAQHRTSQYLQRLQDISTAFPKSVKLSDLVESMYEFASQVVNVSSMLLTLFDRDTDRIYDVFAVGNGTRIEGLVDQPVIMLKEDRPTWWRVTQKEMRSLQFSPSQEMHLTGEFSELLTGIWGDQRQAESFLFLPMKMFKRVIGSLSLTSMQPQAYRPEEVQALETMLQIVTVNIENAKLYERDRVLLHEAKQSAAYQAAINSALQSISSVLNVSEMLNHLVESVAALVKVDVCVFFQLSPDKEELVAQALYAPTSVSLMDDGSGMPDLSLSHDREKHKELISMIRLPFKDTFLEQRAMNEGFFYVDTSSLEELAQKSEEGGVIFLQEINVQQMLMIPMSFNGNFIGVLAVPTPSEKSSFRPKDVGTLLAICAQAANAVSNAQLFEERAIANAELERMNKLKDEFLVTASHELRTPLSAIIGYASLLKRQSSRISPPQVLRFASKIGSAAQQLSDLVENMTEAAKMGAEDKKLEVELEPIQVLTAAESAANMLALDIEQKIVIDVDANLWVNADMMRFRQVLSNLLENAAKYSPPHGLINLSACAMQLAQIENLLSEDQIDHQMIIEQGHIPVILIRVQDQGEGILPHDRLNIFDKFVRAPRSLTTPVRGSGLGLYISRRSVEAMGGKLWLEQSTPNEGSIFSFYLPGTEAPIESIESEEEDQVGF